MVKLRNLIIGGLAMSIVILGLTLVLTTMSTSYGITIENTTWQEDFDTINNLSLILAQESDVIDSTGINPDAFNPFAKLVAGIKLVGVTSKLYADILLTFLGAEFLDIPPSIAMSLLAILGAIVLFAIITAIWRFNI